MNILSRSIRCVRRKWKKSMLLFAIIFSVSTLMISALPILDAQEKETTNLRGATGTSFKIERNLSTGNWSNNTNGSYSTQEFITDDMMKKVASVEGIKGYNGSEITLPVLYDSNGNYLKSDRNSGYADTDAGSYAMGNINTEYNSFFLSNTFALVEGEHIQATDENKVLISKDLADKNGLALGDTIYAVNDPYTNDPKILLEIKGLFIVNADKTDQKNSYDASTYYDYSQYTFMDASAMKSMIVNYVGAGLMDFAEFFVDDPEHLDRILKDTENISSINWNNFKVSANNQIYELAQGAIKSMNGLITNMILVATGISIVIVIIVQSMWIRSRHHELGILLSMGKSKISLLTQFLIELVLIGVLPFSLSFPASQFISTILGSMIGKNVDSIQVSINYLWIVMAIGSGLLVIATMIASVPVLKEKPKAILSRME